MMKSAKFIILPGVYTAILIGAQLVLSGVSGVELVTILFLCFCYRYGIKQGVLVATAFSLLRCFLFGFSPNVIILYLLYYNAFALAFGALGNAFHHEYTLKKHAVILCLGVLFTVLFTMLDNALTPLMFGFTSKAAKAYFIASFYTLVPHLVCTFCTIALLFRPLIKVLK